MYHLPVAERQEEVTSLLWKFVAKKHNGCVKRLNRGLTSDVQREIRNLVRKALDRPDTAKELFARIRQKRQHGRYRRVIYVAPLLQGASAREIPVSSSSSGFLICLSSLEGPLPALMVDKIKSVAGRKKLLPFSTRLVNLLAQNKGSVCLSSDRLQELLGYKNPTQATMYRDCLVQAGLVTVGRHYIKGRESKRHSLTKLAVHLMEEATKAKEQTA
jgi:hypothetical protein